MIVGSGIDTVEIIRFIPWTIYPHTRLQRIFSDTEIAYCLACPTKAAERFAIRFAAREACTKALSALDPSITIPLLTVCKALRIDHHPNGAPLVTISWDLLESYVLPHQLAIHCSLTHTRTHATALILIERHKHSRIT